MNIFDRTSNKSAEAIIASDNQFDQFGCTQLLRTACREEAARGASLESSMRGREKRRVAKHDLRLNEDFREYYYRSNY